jgi:hypothetical protein
MLKTLDKVFSSLNIEAPNGELINVHSHTSREQGLFLQKMFDIVKPLRSLEVGLAYGISALFILEKHKELGNLEKSHIVIEPYPWGGVAEYNLKIEGLMDLVDIRYSKSDEILPRLFYDNIRIQYAYVDTTKVFDTVLQDFYFIDKILDVNGILILDDCNGGWPGVQRVARFINTLPHYSVIGRHNKLRFSLKKRIARYFVSKLISLVPFKNYFYPTINFKNDAELELDYSCIAFKKTAQDARNWDWDVKF